MVVKVYISGISGNKEVKKRQQRVTLILESKNVKYELLDIAEPNMEEAKEYMQNNSKLSGSTISDPNPRHPLPPQLFNDDEYCGDYDAFDMANEIDEMEKFLKLAPEDIPTPLNSKLGNGEVPSESKSKETSPEKDDSKVEESEIQHNENEDDNVPENEDAKIEERPKEKSPSPLKEKSPTPEKEKSPTPKKEKSPTPEKEKSPTLEKEKSATPQKETSPSPANEKDASNDKNATDDQKAEDAENGSKEDELAKETNETEQSENEA